MQKGSSRRLTGPNPQTRAPAALTEIVASAGEDTAGFIRLWAEEVRALCERLGRAMPQTSVRHHGNGLSLALLAPKDALYATIELNDLAVERALARLQGEVAAHDDETLAALQAAFVAEAKPRLIALEACAHRRNVPFLWDDDEISLGCGKASLSWPADCLPTSDEVPWHQLGTIPVVLITGTNGKTTTSRMLARIARMAGYTPGNTSTDGICVNEQVVEEGDWTGPGAARRVLRHPAVDLAVLETARGGILRRGLAVERADVAVLTNVSADHLGDYGVASVAQMTEVKAVVGTVVHERGRVVLCADDPSLRGLDTAKLFRAPVVWYGCEASSPFVTARRHEGSEAWLREGESLIHYDASGTANVLMKTSDIPAAFGGAAEHNVQNALAAAAAACALGISLDKIAAALSTFGANPHDNPGRAELCVHDGVRILLDFGHNAHGADAILKVTHHLLHKQPGRLFVCVGQAGDRSEADIRALCESIARAEPSRLLVRELPPSYSRGRQPGEMPALFTSIFSQLGLGHTVRPAASEADGLRQALREAVPGDVFLMLVHIERDEVAELLQQL